MWVHVFNNKRCDDDSGSYWSMGGAVDVWNTYELRKIYDVGVADDYNAFSKKFADYCDNAEPVVADTEEEW